MAPKTTKTPNAGHKASNEYPTFTSAQTATHRASNMNATTADRQLRAERTAANAGSGSGFKGGRGKGK